MRSIEMDRLMSGKENQMLIAAYGSGVVGVPKLKLELQRVWTEVLSGPATREEAARALKLPDAELVNALREPPFELTPSEAGLGPVESALLVFASGLAYDVVKDVTKEATKASFVALWKLVKQKLELNLPQDAIGKEVKLTKNGEELPPTA
jgi:hypothetical protein